MRSLLAALCMLLFVTLSAPAEAGPNIQSGGKFGIGVELGYPHNGISMNYFFSGSNSLQLAVAFWIHNDWQAFGLRADYLFWMPTIHGWSWADLTWYLGPGGNLWQNTWHGPGDRDGYLGLGAELPIGIGFQFKKVPIDLNLELVPILHLLDDDGVGIFFDLAANLNARFYF